MRDAHERFDDAALRGSLFVVVAVLSLLPLTRLIWEGLAPGGTASTSALVRVLTDASTWTATAHSLVTAFGGTLVAVVIGAIVALVVLVISGLLASLMPAAKAAAVNPIVALQDE